MNNLNIEELKEAINNLENEIADLRESILSNEIKLYNLNEDEDNEESTNN